MITRTGTNRALAGAFAALMAGLWASPALAGPGDEGGYAAHIETEAPLRIHKDRQGFIAAPFAFYTPETRVGGGAGVLAYLDTGGRSVSTLGASVKYTQLKQFQVSLLPQLEWPDAVVKGELTYLHFPGSFFGVGGFTRAEDMERFTPRRVIGQVEWSHRLISHLYVGPRYEADWTTLEVIDPGGRIAEDIRGAQGGLISGVGGQLIWDDRDDTYASRRGTYAYLSALANTAATGSDYTYGRYRLDLRHFVSLPLHHVLALQALAELTGGGAPFYALPALGGQRNMRGYYHGRYRDRHLLVGQAEYRLPLFWRFGAVAFAGAGAVAHSLNQIAEQRIRLAGGGGLRVAVSRENRLNLRADVGYAERETNLYVTFGEAF